MDIIKDARGGARAGAGRKTKFNEIRVVDIALKALEKKYGSLENGFLWLLNYEMHKDVGLVKYAWAHAIGNPIERVAVANFNPLHQQIETLDGYTEQQIAELESVVATVATLTLDKREQSETPL